MVRRLRSLLGYLFLFIAGGVAGPCLVSLTGDLRAQIGQATVTDREAQYAQLDREVSALAQQANVLKTAVKLSRPFVVHIEAKKREGRGTRARLVEEAGSGTLVEHKGRIYVFTNRHVIKDAELNRIVIHLDGGRQINPERVVTDPDTDVAVLFVTLKDATTARLGNSRKVEIGDFVLAVGSPFGLSHSVTYGIVSALGRRELELGGDEVKYQDFIQTDAAINPGNSGGPLLNLRGEVIGMNTAIASSSGGNEGIGFSIPINMVMYVAGQLIEHGRVQRALLGVSLDRRYDAQAAAQLGLPRLQGTRITAITPGSPAEKTGLKVGDVVLQFDGVKVEDDVHLVNLVGLTPAYKQVPIVIFRDGQRLTLQVQVAPRPEPRSSFRPSQRGYGRLGMRHETPYREAGKK